MVIYRYTQNKTYNYPHGNPTRVTVLKAEGPGYFDDNNDYQLYEKPELPKSSLPDTPLDEEEDTHVTIEEWIDAAADA